MIVAGIGSRKGVSKAEVIAAIEAALKAHALAVTDLSGLATTAFKRGEKAIFAAGLALGRPVVVVEDEALLAVSSKTLSHSDLSQALAGAPSVSESAALAAAGANARLFGPRIVVGPVTCAIAISGDRP